MDPVEPWIDAASVRRMAARLLSNSEETELEDRPDAGFGPSFEGFIQAEKPADEAKPPALPPVSANPIEPIEPIEPKVAELKKVSLSGHSLARFPVLSSEADLDASPESEAEPEAVAEEKPTEEVRSQEDEEPAIRVVKPVEVQPSGEVAADRGPLVARMGRFRKWMEGRAEARGVFVLDRDGNPVLDDPDFSKLHFLARSLAQAYRPVPGKPGNVHVKVGAEAYLVVVPVETDFGCLVLGAVLPEPLDAKDVELVSKALATAARPESLQSSLGPPVLDDEGQSG